MRIRLDGRKCVGHGRCYVLAPDVFGEDDRGHCVVQVEGEVPDDLTDQARSGEQNCPEAAIEVVE
jgi:ferredoxin